MAFISTTVLSGNSEVVFIALLAKFPTLFWQCLAVATISNTLVGMTSYGLGRGFPNKAIEIRAITWLKRNGEWALRLSWCHWLAPRDARQQDGCASIPGSRG